MKNKKILDLVYMAMYLALFFVFDWLANVVQLFQMPNGGSLGLGIIPLLMASYHLGWKKGTGVALLAVLLMFLTGKVYIIQNSDGFAPWNIRLPLVSMAWLVFFQILESSILVWLLPTLLDLYYMLLQEYISGLHHGGEALLIMHGI